MKILHLYSNWKWTGPAEHALNLALYLFKKGYDLTFACGPAPEEVEDSLEKRAREGGVPLANRFYLNKHFQVWHDAIDVVRLASFIKERKIDIIHTHLFNDHLIAGVAARCASRKVSLIRTIYEGGGIPYTTRNRMLMSYCTSGVIAVSEASKKNLVDGFNVPSAKIWKICPGVDCGRFNHTLEGSKARKRFGIGINEPVVGIVARVQPHRRFDVFLEAIESVVQKVPCLKVLIIGRGTHIRKVAEAPVEAMGLTHHVVFTGYQLDEYPHVLAAVDIKIFLVPGSDGSCRAVREAMAMGIPVIVARRGMLPEIVEDRVSGLVIDDTPENLAHAIVTLVEDIPSRRKMGEAARRRMQQDFNLELQLAKVEDVYQSFKCVL